MTGLGEWGGGWDHYVGGGMWETSTLQRRAGKIIRSVLEHSSWSLLLGC